MLLELHYVVSMIKEHKASLPVLSTPPSLVSTVTSLLCILCRVGGRLLVAVINGGGPMLLAIGIGGFSFLAHAGGAAVLVVPPPGGPKENLGAWN